MNQLLPENMHSTEIALKKHKLPGLTYDYAALEPIIDSRTMLLHHDIHHGGYVEKLNAVLENFPEFHHYSALWLLCNLEKLPKEIRVAVRHNAGGHVNHSMLWRSMKPGIVCEPNGLLREAINRGFGSVAKFKARFEAEGAKLFGSGWVWLVRTPQNGCKLDVITTSGHDNPMMQDCFPLLVNDVWEHAYYRHYENRRPDYLNAWWSVVNWAEVRHRFELSEKPVEEIWAEEEVLFLATQNE
ncbi:Superoxide dismutase (Mn) 2 [Crenothrix polyspora]|uniref:Superoxide dismutase n=1 Tax=Crenothrix polyspora TaxID=360316 RepID=A0A1R4HBT0_9GAMM|nr:Superoxide dismutase (Mn) 2 [Crenothrix polyspora]